MKDVLIDLSEKVLSELSITEKDDPELFFKIEQFILDNPATINADPKLIAKEFYESEYNQR